MSYTHMRYAEKLWREGKRDVSQLTYDEKVCLTGLIMQKSDCIEDFLDTNEKTSIAEILSALMVCHDHGYNMEREENLKENLAKELIKGAASVAKQKIDGIFATLHCYPPQVDDDTVYETYCVNQ